MVSCAKRVAGDDIQNIANAHLISAAPDMHESLLYAVECISHGCMPGVAWMENAWGALRKARGEA